MKLESLTLNPGWNSRGRWKRVLNEAGFYVYWANSSDF